MYIIITFLEYQIVYFQIAFKSLFLTDTDRRQDNLINVRTINSLSEQLILPLFESFFFSTIKSPG